MADDESNRLIPLSEVASITGLKPAKVRALVKRTPPEFPVPFVVSSGGRLRWSLHEVEAWDPASVTPTDAYTERRRREGRSPGAEYAGPKRDARPSPSPMRVSIVLPPYVAAIVTSAAVSAGVPVDQFIRSLLANVDVVTSTE